MPRARLISPEFWTSETVVDCAPMTRLLLLGLANFADDLGVQPMRPRTVRLQIFPGDALDDDAVAAMLEELIARGLLRRYTVEGVDYLSILDWEIHQRVGKRARRRYPADPAAVTASVAEPPPPPAPAPVAEAPPPRPDVASDAWDEASWQSAVETALRRGWGPDLPDGVARYATQWCAERRDFAREVVPAINRTARVAVYAGGPFDLEAVHAAMGAHP
jgi:hypothetical protein